MDAAQKPAPAAPAAASVLRRDDEHLYWLLEPPQTAEENLLGVNETLVDLGFESDDYFTEEHSSRGVAIHHELAQAARGFEPFPFLDPDLYGWRQSGLDFLAKLLADGAVILGVEEMRWHPLYRFAGTLDLRVLWRAYEWIIDWKTGRASKVTRFKLAAYDMLAGPAANGRPRKKMAVELQRDGGRAKPVEYNGSEFFHDGNRFLSYINTLRDRRMFGPKRA